MDMEGLDLQKLSDMLDQMQGAIDEIKAKSVKAKAKERALAIKRESELPC